MVCVYVVWVCECVRCVSVCGVCVCVVCAMWFVCACVFMCGVSCVSGEYVLRDKLKLFYS